jgi:SAM-dependent methyltransferase
MKTRTLLSLLGSGQLALLLSLMRPARSFYRLSFLGAGLSSGWLRRLANGPAPLDTLAGDLEVDASMRDGLVAWLQMGVVLGEWRSGPAGYSLRGRLARQLLEPANDAVAAWVEEMALLDNFLIIQAPDRLRTGKHFTLADHDARLIARSSRLVEPFLCEVLDALIPRGGAFKLFEIGCGSAAYLRHAAARNPELTALGLELQPAAGALATENIARWHLAGRVAIEVGDVMLRSPEPVFHLATLHQNIYYFPVERRVSALRHVRGFLRPGGHLFLTTWSPGRGLGAPLPELWAGLTEGRGRLPTVAEMVAQLEAAGFSEVRRRSLVPGESFYSFVGVNR